MPRVSRLGARRGHFRVGESRDKIEGPPRSPLRVRLSVTRERSNAPREARNVCHLNLTFNREEPVSFRR